jgi:hypothetical protein
LNLAGFEGESVGDGDEIDSLIPLQTWNSYEVEELLETGERILCAVRGIRKGTEEKGDRDCDSGGSASEAIEEPAEAEAGRKKHTRIARSKVNLHGEQPFLTQGAYWKYMPELRQMIEATR